MYIVGYPYTPLSNFHSNIPLSMYSLFFPLPAIRSLLFSISLRSFYFSLIFAPFSNCFVYSPCVCVKLLLYNGGVFWHWSVCNFVVHTSSKGGRGLYEEPNHISEWINKYIQQHTPTFNSICFAIRSVYCCFLQSIVFSIWSLFWFWKVLQYSDINLIPV